MAKYWKRKKVNNTFVPPSLDVYIQFSLQSSFMIFWGILLLQSITIFIVDKIWVKNIPQTTNLWNRILHSIQKSSYPFPYTNWHEENGTCLQHLQRKKLVDQEVLVTITVNLVFNMILLFPLPIFCKSIYLIFCFHSNHAWLTKLFFHWRSWCLGKTESSGKGYWCIGYGKWSIPKSPAIFLDLLPYMDFFGHYASNLFPSQ